jgi:hypothetical protein
VSKLIFLVLLTLAAVPVVHASTVEYAEGHNTIPDYMTVGWREGLQRQLIA